MSRWRVVEGIIAVRAKAVRNCPSHHAFVKLAIEVAKDAIVSICRSGPSDHFLYQRISRLFVTGMPVEPDQQHRAQVPTRGVDRKDSRGVDVARHAHLAQLHF
jgi:hypothetical protein